MAHPTKHQVTELCWFIAAMLMLTGTIFAPYIWDETVRILTQLGVI
jgi:hypothetical protein